MFRFSYKKSFLRSILRPSGYFKEWIIGIRYSAKNELMACITGIPVTASLDGPIVKCA
jgi:glycylpeptide N-tetradecanoyltransferase